MLQAAAISLPVFASSSASDHPPATTSRISDDGEALCGELRQGEGWQMESSNTNDTMDFDLLAEYLLDDTPGAASSGPFDFNGSDPNENGNAANAEVGVISAEQSEDGATPPVSRNVPPQMAQPQQLQAIHQHQAALAAAQAHMNPTSVAIAPSFVAPFAPVPAAHVPPPPSFASHSGGHPSVIIAPTPGIAVPGVVPQQVTATKRRRVDGAVAQLVPPQMPPMLNDPMAVAAALQGRGRKKTQAQIDRRRERNRILARRTRLRKKFFFESLQKEVMDLQRENAALKDIVRGQLNNDEGKKLLDECDAAENLPSAVMEACGEQATDMDQQDFNLVKSIQQSQHCFVISDPSLQDNPIVFASDDFLSLTGYSREDVLGRNCRFLQGTNTSEAKVAQIRKGLSIGEDVSVTLVNYTADGTPFWNKLFIAALRDAQNNIVNFIGVIVKVASPEPDDPEHGTVLPGDNFDGAAEGHTSPGVVGGDSGPEAMNAHDTIQTIGESTYGTIGNPS